MNDKLIAEFVQVDAMAPLGMSAAQTQGACHNFTIHWLNLMIFEDSDAVSDTKAAINRMTKLSAGKGGGNAVLQKVYGQRWNELGNSFQDADNMPIALRGLKGSAVIGYSTFNQDDFVKKIKKPDFAGFIYSFWFTDSVVGAPGGAHTIGFYRALTGKGGKLVPTKGYVDHVSAFDPNYGEYYVPVIEFNYWFNKLKQAYGGGLTHQMLKCVSKA